MAILATIPFVLGQRGQSPKPLEIPGVSLEEAKFGGIVLTVPEGESAKVTAEQAIAKTPEKVDEAVLAHLTSRSIEPNIDRLVWVLLMNRDSRALSGDGDYLSLYINVVDASTGDWLFGYGDEKTCGETAETMAECARRGITPKAQEP